MKAAEPSCEWSLRSKFSLHSAPAKFYLGMGHGIWKDSRKGIMDMAILLLCNYFFKKITLQNAIPTFCLKKTLSEKTFV